jgi:hypothetical protein
MKQRKLQIGVMGSAQDLNYGDVLRDLAREIGKEIALSGHIVVYGAEKDYDSLSTHRQHVAQKRLAVSRLVLPMARGRIFGKRKDLQISLLSRGWNEGEDASSYWLIPATPS